MNADMKDLTAINREVADIVVNNARPLTPHESGDLERTIRRKATQTRAAVQAGSAKVPYAGPIHFGWFRRNIDPQPFLYSGLRQSVTMIERRYDRRVSELVERVGRETPG